MRYIALFLFLISTPAFAQEGPCEVSRIIDGDTFVCITDGEEYKVRLIGMDCPELPTHEGIEAKEYVEEIMPVGTVVRLELDVQTYDRYHRVLAYVWLPSGDMLNEVLLRDGYAVLMTVPPNVARVDEFKAISSRR
ncbi:MAG: thermonuclease family protein [Candidatus Dadabacteria bacterium]